MSAMKFGKDNLDAAQVRELDKGLADMAKYAATKGGTVPTTREVVMWRFLEFKSIVMRSEASVEELRDMVYRRWGDPSWVPEPFKGIREMVVADLKVMPKGEVC